ncbi:hypothetical protein RJ640_016661 [Escallonia rubra]|uniref:Uncharacterized protein n=1 Tax=Escallonia rubra TaxID=112253 RepID=A0AA88UUU8_9ASTE|nr:hypothetical protein RJ640_016661 [Escallonia rubra]
MPVPQDVEYLCKQVNKVYETSGRMTLHIIDFDILYGFQWPCLIQGISPETRWAPKASDYRNRHASTRSNIQFSCKLEVTKNESCLQDCFCAFAIHRGDSCWKKKLPLSNRTKDSSVNGKAFLKFRKGDLPPQPRPKFQGSKDHGSLIVVGSVLLAGFQKYCSVKRLRNVVQDGDTEFWFWDCFQEGRLDALVENDKQALNDWEKFKRFVMVGIWYVQEDLSLRPAMKKIIQMLEENVEVAVPSCPFPNFNSTYR